MPAEDLGNPRVETDRASNPQLRITALVTMIGVNSAVVVRVAVSRSSPRESLPRTPDRKKIV